MCDGKVSILVSEPLTIFRTDTKEMPEVILWGHTSGRCEM